MSNRKMKCPLAGTATRGRTRCRRIGDRDIPRRVASPQSLTPLLPALSQHDTWNPVAIRIDTMPPGIEKGANRLDYERYDKRGPGNPRTYTLVAQLFAELHARP